MRHAVILGAVLLASPIIGQDDPLPAVTPRVQPVLVALAVEPVHEVESITLEDAARANDYATFHSLFEQTGSAAYAPLHELWTYSVNDPIGAFYGAEMYERFAALYPDFAPYIDEYKIVDDHGNEFYPTSETRSFLLAKAVEGRVVAPREPIRVASAPRRSAFTPTPTPTPDTAPIRRVRMQKAEAAPQATPAQEPVGLKPDLRSAPVAQVASVAPEPIVAEPVPAPQPIFAASVLPPVPEAPPPAKNDLAGRGILLIIIGLTGIGFLALIVRTPREQEPPVSPVSPPAGDLRKAPH